MRVLHPAATIPEPAASGLLAERPLAHLLAYTLQHGLSGTFELADEPSQFARIVIEQGRVARVWLNEAVCYLGDILHEGGVLTEAQLTDSLEEAGATKTLHGQVLLAQGLISEAHLSTALSYQRLRKLHHAFTFPATSKFTFYADLNLMGSPPNEPEPSDPIPSIWRGIATQPSWDHVNAALAAVGARPVRVLTRFDTQSFREAERAAIESLCVWPENTAAIASRPGVDPRAAELIVYFLMITKLGDVDEGPTSIPPAPPPAFSVRNPAARASGLPPDIRSVPPEAAHDPDTSALPPASLSSPPASLSPQSLFGDAASSAGPSSQSVPPLSSGSVRPLAPTSIRPSSRGFLPEPPPEKNPEAERALDDAEMHFLLGERPEALNLVRKALELTPKMPAGLVLFAALEASTVKKGDDYKLREIVKRLDSLIAKEPQVRRGRFYRAQLKRRIGDLEGAADDLRKAVEDDPEDAESRRDLRIVEKLLTLPKGGGSFLDKLRSKLQ